MKKKSTVNSFQDFCYSVADYIDAEYSSSEFDSLNDDEKQTIHTMMLAHYDYDGCVSNVANEIIHYLRTSRSWKESNGIH